MVNSHGRTPSPRQVNPARRDMARANVSLTQSWASWLSASRECTNTRIIGAKRAYHSAGSARQEHAGGQLRIDMSRSPPSAVFQAQFRGRVLRLLGHGWLVIRFRLVICCFLINMRFGGAGVSCRPPAGPCARGRRSRASALLQQALHLLPLQLNRLTTLDLSPLELLGTAETAGLHHSYLFGFGELEARVLDYSSPLLLSRVELQACLHLTGTVWLHHVSPRVQDGLPLKHRVSFLLLGPSRVLALLRKLVLQRRPVLLNRTALFQCSQGLRPFRHLLLAQIPLRSLSLQSLGQPPLTMGHLLDALALELLLPVRRVAV